MRSPCAFDLVSVSFARTGPPFWRPENQHGPTRFGNRFAAAGCLLNTSNLVVCPARTSVHDVPDIKARD